MTANWNVKFGTKWLLNEQAGANLATDGCKHQRPVA